jgi:flagellar basal body-associated protein FliL
VSYSEREALVSILWIILIILLVLLLLGGFGYSRR